MSAAQPKTNPRLYTHVLAAIAELKENSGSHIRTIISHVQSAFNVASGKPKPRNVALQVRRAIQHGIATGVLRQKGGRVRLSLGNKNNKGIRTGCGFICRKKKKGRKGGILSKIGFRKRRGKHKGGSGRGGHKKSKRRRSRSRSHSSSSRSGSRDHSAPKRKSKRSGGRRRKGGSAGGGKHKRRHSSGGGSKHGAPKRKKKARRSKKKPAECNVQQYSNEHNEEDENTCTCQQNENDQKNSHVSFADEDEICGEQQQCADLCAEQIEKRKRSNRPPRRTSRQIRQGTPKNFDRCNPEFIPQQINDVIRSNEHVPRSCNRNKEDYGVSKNQNIDYINKNFDNNDIHGTSQECDNPDCLCNIKQEPLDGNEDKSKIIRDHCPERFSERKRNDRDRVRDPDKSRDRNKDRDPDRVPDRPRVRDRDRDRDRDGRENYFTN